MKPQNESARPALPSSHPHPHAHAGHWDWSWLQGWEGKEAEGRLASFSKLNLGEGVSDEKPGELTVMQPANPALFCHLKAHTSHDTWPLVLLSSPHVSVALPGRGTAGHAQACSQAGPQKWLIEHLFSRSLLLAMTPVGPLRAPVRGLYTFVRRLEGVGKQGGCLCRGGQHLALQAHPPHLRHACQPPSQCHQPLSSNRSLGVFVCVCCFNSGINHTDLTCGCACTWRPVPGAWSPVPTLHGC